MRFITAAILLLKNTTFLLLLCLSLLVSTVSIGVKAAALSASVASLTATTLAHRGQIRKAVARTKAKARLRRIATAVPLLGIAAAAAFERQDFIEWKDENAEGTKAEYACEVATDSAEVIDDVLVELPEKVRPSKDLLLSYLPKM